MLLRRSTTASPLRLHFAAVLLFLLPQLTFALSVKRRALDGAQPKSSLKQTRASDIRSGAARAAVYRPALAKRSPTPVTLTCGSYTGNTFLLSASGGGSGAIADGGQFLQPAYNYVNIGTEDPFSVIQFRLNAACELVDTVGNSYVADATGNDFVLRSTGDNPENRPNLICTLSDSQLQVLTCAPATRPAENIFVNDGSRRLAIATASGDLASIDRTGQTPVILTAIPV